MNSTAKKYDLLVPDVISPDDRTKYYTYEVVKEEQPALSDGIHLAGCIKEKPVSQPG